MRMAHQPLTTVVGELVGVAAEQGRDFGFNGLCQQRAGTVTQNLGQRIGKTSWLGEFENVSVGHGVSLLRWRSGGVEHPHDTPPYLLPTRERIMAGQPQAAPLLELAERAERLGFDSVWAGNSLLARPRHCWRAFAQIQTDLRPDGRVEICLLIKLAGEATASRRRAVYRASQKRGRLARLVDLVERGDKRQRSRSLLRLDQSASNPACAGRLYGNCCMGLTQLFPCHCLAPTW